MFLLPLGSVWFPIILRGNEMKFLARVLGYRMVNMRDILPCFLSWGSHWILYYLVADEILYIDT